MRFVRLPRLRFSLKSLLILTLGIAIGFSLNLKTLQHIVGLAANEAFPTRMPPYVIQPPDVLLIDVLSKVPGAAPLVSGKFPVGPDGLINLGEYGQVLVSGKTLAEARLAVIEVLKTRIPSPRVGVDVFAYESKNFYIVVQGRGTDDGVMRVPLTGNETVLDGLAQLNAQTNARIIDATAMWIARPAHNGLRSDRILPVNWEEISQGSATTNYQLFPGDRLFVSYKD
jgi:polysaccharide export outer membrane protein